MKNAVLFCRVITALSFVGMLCGFAYIFAAVSFDSIPYIGAAGLLCFWSMFVGDMLERV